MNLNISCFATIGKKFAKLCKDNPLFIYIQPTSNGKMIARLKTTCSDDIKIDDIKKVEDISIILEIDEISEDIKDLGNEVPIQSLYTSAENEGGELYDSDGRMKKGKIAITEPDSEIKRYESAKKVDNTEKIAIQIEKMFPENLAKFPEKLAKVGKNFISDYNCLTKTISTIKDVDKPIPQVSSNKKLSRGEAIELGKSLQSVPRLPCGVYISNETKGKLCIDDLNLVLNINEISDISSIPAQKIKNSRQLKSSYTNGLIKFRSEGEFNEWCDKHSDNEDVIDRAIGLEVFDNHEEAVAQTESVMVSTEEVSKGKKTVSKPTMFTNKKNILKKSDKELLVKEDNDERGLDMEVTGTEDTEEEKELKELIKNLPKDKEIEDGENIQQKPLLSDQVENQEKNKIKRI
jgi:hypothetical protein